LIKEAIILAGGLGTRLRDTVPDLPKCMAPVAGEPFLTHVIRSLLANGIQKFIFSLGYKHEIIELFLEERFATLDYKCVIEDDPLGTGGAIQLACEQASEENVLIVNGDTLFKINVSGMLEVHKKQNAECTIALKPMQNFDRYGVVELNKENLVTKFCEKQFYKEGLINGGVYVLNVPTFLSRDLGNKFSFEKDYLEAFYHENKIAGIIQDGYFIDIGIPKDFEKAQFELKQPPLDLKKIDSTGIHEHMLAEIQSNGGRIDKIYFCISTEKTAFNRKPNPGMALLARKDFPEVDFSKSIMVGNKLTDMLFGRNAGIFTVFVATTNPDIAFPHPDIDLRFNNLLEFAKAL